MKILQRQIDTDQYVFFQLRHKRMNHEKSVVKYNQAVQCSVNQLILKLEYSYTLTNLHTFPILLMKLKALSW